ncbi:sodium/solute symporter [Desulfofundulus thermobenzoicus]|uniref:Sodium/solute symporter n=1 Tax=Desulfofundulus thermobenzoicus TaxID=29376 RepID=A0A6N7IUA3_9FIRM|nr:sodium/solute symporter [Desulfofundulus thermobenzoicus]MQL52678.1 sodium/solute symporter [Desulfofundulus thermobenzoicus]HHW44988.1 sodium/solute symporter [Desulfotomaculum sp.]
MKWLLLGIFVCVLLYSGYRSMVRTRTVNDFFLGGRAMGPWLSAFAYGTTYFSAVIFIGYAGKVGWGFGLAGLWIVLGNTLLGSLLAWLVLAKRTRLMTARLGAMTMPEFLEARYQCPSMKIFSALVIFLFLVPYSASVYMGLSYLFNQIFGIPYLYAALLMCLLTAVYLVMGGYRAVALTDFIQGLVMLAGVGALLYFVLAAPQVGGLLPGIKRLAEINPGLASVTGPGGQWLPLASLVILTSLGPWGLPQMVQKFYAIRNERAIRPAMVVATLFALVITFGAYFTGALTHLFFDKLPLDPATGKPTPDMLMPILIHNTLPEFGALLILLLVLSASMSTLASLVLVSSSAISIDLVQAVRPALGKKHGVLLLRILCLLFIVLSLILALAKPAIILSLMAMSWGTVAGAFLAPYLYGLFWRGTTAAGAWAGILGGLGISIVPSLYFHLDPGVIPMVGCLAMIIPLLVVPAVSLITPPLPAEVLDRAFGPGDAFRKGRVLLQSKEVEST